MSTHTAKCLENDDVSSATTLPPMGPPPPSARRFTVDEYHRILAAGVFKDGDPFELLEGWIVPKMARNPRHDLALGLVEDALTPMVVPIWVVRVQCAITTPDSEPEPDLAIVLGPRRRYGAVHPLPADIGLIIEVSESTLMEDRGRKLQIYARAGIPQYWTVNLIDSQIEAYSEPVMIGAIPAYRVSKAYRRGDFAPLVLNNQAIGQVAVADVPP